MELKQSHLVIRTNPRLKYCIKCLPLEQFYYISYFFKDVLNSVHVEFNEESLPMYLWTDLFFLFEVKVSIMNF